MDYPSRQTVLPRMQSLNSVSTHLGAGGRFTLRRESATRCPDSARVRGRQGGTLIATFPAALASTMKNVVGITAGARKWSDRCSAAITTDGPMYPRRSGRASRFSRPHVSCRRSSSHALSLRRCPSFGCRNGGLPDPIRVDRLKRRAKLIRWNAYPFALLEPENPPEAFHLAGLPVSRKPPPHSHY